MENVPLTEPKDLKHFINVHSKNGEKSEQISSNPKIRSYLPKHPSKHPELESWEKEHRIVSKSSTSSSSSKGFDFLQEEDLKGVMKHLPKGTLFDQNSFSRAVHIKQNYEFIIKQDMSPKRNRLHDKYISEAQFVGTKLLESKIAKSDFSEGNLYCADLFEIKKIFEKNLKHFFTMKIDCFETSNIKMKIVHFIKEEKEKSEQLEKKSKEDIIKLILELADSSNLEAEDLEVVVYGAKMTKTKPQLIDLYNSLLETIFQTEVEMDE